MFLINLLSEWILWLRQWLLVLGVAALLLSICLYGLLTLTQGSRAARIDPFYATWKSINWCIFYTLVVFFSLAGFLGSLEKGMYDVALFAIGVFAGCLYMLLRELDRFK